ncbi:MAG: PAS domain-containing protein [Actinomycetota bacterium]
MPDAPKTRSLVLILAKDLASRLATPTLVVDENGMLVYFNEAAESVFGTTYADSGLQGYEDLAKTFQPQDDAGNRIALKELPITVAVLERRPAHGTLSIEANDGVTRHLAATAFPLFAHKDELVGAISIFWERLDGEA